MWFLSAEKGDLPFITRMVITDNVSRTGIPRRRRGRTGLTAVSPCVRASERVTAVNPSSWLPVSPMNTVAGWVL